MARKKKQVKSKRARANVVRQDYRKGGRVGLAHGAFPDRKDYDWSTQSGAKSEFQSDKNEWYAAKAAHDEADRIAKLNEPPKETETDVSETTDLTDDPAPGTGASDPAEKPSTAPEGAATTTDPTGTGTTAPPEEAQDQPKKPNVKDYPVYELDENGNTKLDDEGNPIPKLNEEGNPVFDEEKFKEDQIKYQKAIASWRRDEALRRAKLYGTDGTTTATISEKIGTFGGAVTTPKGEVATLTSQGVDEETGLAIPGAVERGITADEDIEQISRYEFEIDADGTPKLDEDGKPIIKTDDKGNPILRSRVSKPTETEKVTVDEMSASTVEDTAVAGLYEPEVDEDGNPIPGSIKRGDDGLPIPIEGLDAETYDAVKSAAFPRGYSETPPPDAVYPPVMPGDGMKWVYGPTGNRIAVPEDAVSMDIDPTTGTLSDEAEAKVTEIRALTEKAVAAERDEEAETKAKATNVPAIISDGAFVPEVDGVGGQVSETADAELKQRIAITDNAPSRTEAEIINNLGFEAASRNIVQGVYRTGAAAEMIEETADLPPEVAAAIVEDPASVEAQLDLQEVKVQAAIAALPTEALMSSQLNSLIGGMESGNVPMWAKPAVDQVTQMMAQRGLNVSTVARDSLFNAIIQSALPIAQNNAQALQQRAAQNLSNEQQANLAQATQDMQRRMANLANRQDAENRTQQHSQQLRVLQSQFGQQARMTTEQQQQQIRVQNLQNEQQAAVIRSQNQQAINVQELGNDQQMELANLAIKNETERENMTADQQGRILEYQTAADFMVKNATFTQDMRKANLSSEQQILLANLSALNQAESENLTAEQQTELANLNKRMQVNLRNAELANQMGIAQLNVDQQRAMQNASMVANMDMSKFNNAQQVELANSKFLQTMTITDFNAEQQAAMQNATALASLDLATVDQRTKVAIENARNFLQVDMANINNDQQALIMESQLRQQRLLSDQSATNASLQFNSTSENQTNQFITGLGAQLSQFNAQQNNAMKQFNVSEKNRMEAIEAGNTLEADKFNNQLSTQIDQYNASLDYQRDQWNAANAQAVEQGNIAWRRQANTIDTAAKNAVNQQNAMNAFNLTKDAQSALWQELRDKATFSWQGGQNQLDRISRLLSTALSNDAIKANESLGYGDGTLADLFDLLTD